MNDNLAAKKKEMEGSLARTQPQPKKIQEILQSWGLRRTTQRPETKSFDITNYKSEIFHTPKIQYTEEAEAEGFPAKAHFKTQKFSKGRQMNGAITPDLVRGSRVRLIKGTPNFEITQTELKNTLGKKQKLIPNKGSIIMYDSEDRSQESGPDRQSQASNSKIDVKEFKSIKEGEDNEQSHQIDRRITFKGQAAKNTDSKFNPTLPVINSSRKMPNCPRNTWSKAEMEDDTGHNRSSLHNNRDRTSFKKMRTEEGALGSGLDHIQTRFEDDSPPSRMRPVGPQRNSFSPDGSERMSILVADKTRRFGSPIHKDSFNNSIYGFRPTIKVEPEAVGSAENLKAFTIDRSKMINPLGWALGPKMTSDETPLTTEYFYYKSLQYRNRTKNVKDLIDKLLKQMSLITAGMSGGSPSSCHNDTNSLMPNSKINDSKILKLSMDNDENGTQPRGSKKDPFTLRVTPVGIDTKAHIYPASTHLIEKPKVATSAHSRTQTHSPFKEDVNPKGPDLDLNPKRDELSSVDRDIEGNISRLFEINNFEITALQNPKNAISVSDEEFQIRTAKHFRVEQLQINSLEYNREKSAYLELCNLLEFLTLEVGTISHADRDAIKHSFYMDDPTVLAMIAVYELTSGLTRKRG